MAAFVGGASGQAALLASDHPRLMLEVRKPFVSETTAANVLEPSRELIIESQMSASGGIVSDGVASDFLQFNAGAIARIRAAKEQAKLVTT